MATVNVSGNDRDVNQLTQEQLEYALRLTAIMDDEIREAVHNEQALLGIVTKREWLREYCERHQAKHGAPWCM